MNSEKARGMLLLEINALLNNNGDKDVIECYKRMIEDSIELESWKAYAKELEETVYE